MERHFQTPNVLKGKPQDKEPCGTIVPRQKNSRNNILPKSFTNILVVSNDDVPLSGLISHDGKPAKPKLGNDISKRFEFEPFSSGSNLPHKISLNGLRLLADVEAIPIAAGGIGGAEGSIALLIKGTEEHVRKAVSLVQKIKGEAQVEEP